MLNMRAEHIWYAAFFAVIIGGLAIVNMQGWERDDRPSLERRQAEKRSTEYKERADRGPYVVRRTDLSTDEELVHIAIPSVHWGGNPRLDTSCLVYRDLAGGSRLFL